MTDSRSVSLLSEILTGLLRSLPQYVAECWPWTHRGDADAYAVVKGIIDQEQRRAEEVAQAIVERGGLLIYPPFPDWTRLNFVALDYLLDHLVHFQETAVARFEAIRDQFAEGTEQRALAESVVEDAKKHLGQLQELAARHQYSQQVSVVTEQASN